MKKNVLLTGLQSLLGSLLLVGFLLSPLVTFAQSPSPTPTNNKNLEEVNREIEELKKKIGELQAERNTLAANIRFLDSKILLNEKEIQKTEQEIELLGVQVADLTERVRGLEGSLAELSSTLVERVQEQYKRRSTDTVSLLFATAGLSEFFNEYKYLDQARAHTQQLLISTEEKRQVYDEEKAKKELKQKEVEALQLRLESQQKELQLQKQDKQKLLDVTKNDERIYQQRLEAAMAEFGAIQSIIAGRGNETEVGDVKTGERIASIISGPSVCSTGAHLHFEVVKNGAHVNPASYLRSSAILWQDASFEFSGSWDWPVDDPARVTQGYGMTSFARSGFYGGKPHTGIDMLSKSGSNWTVKAVQDGKLYRGAIRCRGGLLRYVRVKHNDDISTYYLHVNY